MARLASAELVARKAAVISALRTPKNINTTPAPQTSTRSSLKDLKAAGQERRLNHEAGNATDK
jgi:hypothetical protein